MIVGQTHPDDSQNVKSDLLKIFRYLQAVNHQRNPPHRHLNKAPTTCFHDLLDHWCIQRGRAGAEMDAWEGDGEDYFLKVSRPNITEPPSPPAEIAGWVRSGWQNVDGTI